MQKMLKAFMLIFILFITQNCSIASDGRFGTKVIATDCDIGKVLNILPYLDIRYWDTGPNPGIYDEEDIVYIIYNQFPAPPAPKVKANDIRIIKFQKYLPGSKVKVEDEDLDMPLSSFVPTHALVYLDLFKSSAFDLKDPVYFRIIPPDIDTNDIRFTNITSELSAGTKVRNFDPDHSKHAAQFQALPASGIPTLFAYFDTNGNSIYDYPDDLYLLPPNPQSLTLPQHVRVNSVRLSGPVGSVPNFL